LVREILRVASQSKLQANIFLENIPFSSEARSIIKMNDKKKIHEIILNGGEDYELLFSSGSNNRKKIDKIKNITRIGNFSNGRGLKIFDRKFQHINLKKKGFSHF